MSSSGKSHVFDRSGLAALSDLEKSQCQEIFAKLELEQDVFLARETEFRSANYQWPRDPLHTWSRVWESPYVYYHLAKAIRSDFAHPEVKVADVGSGVTFFPYSVARLGYHVHCLDIEGSYETDIHRATGVVRHDPGTVDFRLISDGRLPLRDGELDAAYSISVLEHIPDFENSIKEVFRVLKSNGLFILTIDVDLCGYSNIGVQRYYDLRELLAQYFDFKKAEFSPHPLDLLQPRNSLFPCFTYSISQKWKFHISQHIKRLVGRKSQEVLPNLAIWGAVMARKDELSS